MPPIVWWLALAVWGYLIVWMILLSGIRVLALRLVRPRLQHRRPDLPGALATARES